jgi:hypothetical protein
VDAAHLRDVLLPPASRGQQTGLGRLTPSQYRWAPNSQALLFIGAQQLAWYDLKSKDSRHLLPAPATPLQPDRRKTRSTTLRFRRPLVSFIRNHDLWVVSAAGGSPAAAGAARQLTRDGSDTLRNGELDWSIPKS